MSKYNLEKILPHKPPMILLDDIEQYSLEKQNLSANFEVHPKKMFFDANIDGVNSLVGLEFMAQAIGCYSYFKSGCQEPEPGLLLGTRLFNNSIEKFKRGEKYTVFVQELYSDEQIHAFDCRIADKNDVELQNACIKVYKSEDIEGFLK